MRIAFATSFDLGDMRRGSGTYYFMYKELIRQGHSVCPVGPIPLRLPLISRIVRAVHAMSNRRHVAFLDPFVGRWLGKAVGAALAQQSYDLLLTNDLAMAAYTPTRKPVLLYTDVMITHDYRERMLPHARLGKLSALGLWLARQTLRAGLKRANLVVFPVQWAADEALFYGVEQAKVRVIPFGANVLDPGAEVVKKRMAPSQDVLELLFVGKDWGRKGGEVAVETARLLRERGVKAVLHCVGGQGAIEADGVRFYGLLDKSVPAQQGQLIDLYQRCHLLILPSSSEGFVIVALEAAAFGMPAIAYRVNGVTDAIRHNETGFLLPLGSSAQQFADKIEEWLQQPEQYHQLAGNARLHYENSVNWTKSVHSLTGEMEKLLAKNPTL